MLKSTALFSLFVFSQIIQSAPIEKDSLTRSHIVLNEVVVTSYKEKRNIQETPASITRISGFDMQNKNIQGVKDFSASIPNLFIPDYGSKLTSPVYIRGIGSKINAPSVGLYVDGIPYFEKSVFDFEMNEVERIDVLRGPQGTLYGRNTMGGIINVYTKKPLTYNGINLSATAANYGQRQLAGSYYGAIKQNFGYVVSGSYKHSDGFFHNQCTDKMADELNSGTGKVKLYWKPTSKLNIGFHTSYDYSDQGGYPYGKVDAKTGEIAAVNYNDESFYRRGIFTSGLSVDYVFNHFTMKSVTGYQYFDDKQAIDQDFTDKSTYYATQEQKQKMFFEELSMQSNKGNRYNWMSGAFLFYQGLDNTIKVHTKTTKTLTVKTYDSPTKGLALYHQSELVLLPKLLLTAGVRLDYEKASQDYAQVVRTQVEPIDEISNVPSTPKLTGSSDVKEFIQLTPKASLRYSFNHQNMIYTTVTKGYKTGGFNTSFSTSDEQSFSPEYSWNYEIGAKCSFFNNRLLADVSLFYIDWKNQQVSQPVTQGEKTIGSMLRNAGKSSSKGVELSLIAKVCKELNLQMNYGYTDAQYTTYKSGKSDFSGNYIPYVPQQTLMIGGDYALNFRSALVNRLVFSTQYIGTGKLYWGDDNSTHQGYYGVVNGKVSAHKGRLRVDLWIKNATSSHYTAFNFKMGADSFAQRGKPMTFGTTFAYTIN